MRHGLVLPIALFVLALASPLADASFHGPEAAAAKAKGKKKKCKRGKVAVTLAGRKRCLPVRGALPAPKAGDPRAEAIKEALTPSIASVPDPRDKVPPPMEKVYRKLGPKALGGMEKMVGIALKRVDALAAAKAARPAIASASADSGGSFSQQFGNVTIDARISVALVGAELVGQVQFGTTTDRGDGTTVRVSTEIPLRIDKMGFRSPGCPTIEGKLDAKDGIGITVRSEVRSNQGKTLEQFFITEVVDETEMQGIVADDAKLDSLEIRSIQKVTEHAGGSAFGGSTINGSIVRNTVVDMRTGQYVPQVTLVNVGVKLSGVLNVLAPFLRPQVAERLKKTADKDFAAAVDFETKEFRELEKGWNEPNHCVKLVFGKARESLTLEKGEAGNESVRVEAKAGGAPAKANWTVTAQQAGSFSLSSHGANPTGFHFQATEVGKGVKVVGGFRAVSKAGVAEDHWIQKTKEDEGLRTISGNFGGELSAETALKVPSKQVWSGVASFEQVFSEGGPSGVYVLKSGSVSVDLSGIEQSGITGCYQSGFGSAPVSGGSMTVTGTGPNSGAPYLYSVELQLPLLTIKATRHDCPEAAQKEGYEGSGFDTSPFWKLSRSGEESTDGLSYVGSAKETFGPPGFLSSFEENWTLFVDGKA